ncbi:thiol reductase thioredoxin [Halalkalibacillus sediminis]|uniref:Thiol reductase thioredoxin n=1 Tax=Halalkalibacillus sediminis TaxID=2018042 RepID=A0A2I0QRU8_9BACI|nr:thioredoxin family protein [Halalkalibacillus sediminis]PKR77064.1 thiol reductase thioredoxin [Halalkalibacillus sediminis]
MKKLLIFGGIIVILFIATAFLTNMAETENVEEDNPYGKDRLHAETADLLDDPHYQNIITPEELDEKLENGEDVTVYFFSPTCGICQETTPEIMPLAEEMGVDLVQYNVLEFQEAWDSKSEGGFGIEGTPTVVHFEDGEEVDQRVVGRTPNEGYQSYFEKYVLD